MIESSGVGMISLLRGLLGLSTILGLAYLFSNNRKQIDWRLVITGLSLQLVLALSILYVPVVGSFFEILGKVFVKLVDFTQDGVSFLLGPYATKENGSVFIIHALPSLIFFSALVSLFYYWGIIQRIVNLFSRMLRLLFRNLSGEEGLILVGNVFLGMNESPILAKDYLPKMTKSELFLVMVSGMGTIAGTVLGAYIGILGGADATTQVFFAKHLLSASVMAAPGAIVISKMLCPQVEAVDHDAVRMEKINDDSSAMEALASGTNTGMRLFVNIVVMLLVFIALVSLVNYLLHSVVGRYTGLNEWIVSLTNGKVDGFSLQFIFGTLLSPFMWLLGVPSEDIMSVGSLLGQKTILNEFIGYLQLQEWKDAGQIIYQKSIVMSTYMLCGFANISSVGMLIGGLSVLAPKKRSIIASMGFHTMLGGTLVSLLSAVLVGMIIG